MSCRACEHERIINDMEGYENWSDISEILGHDCTEWNCKHSCALKQYSWEDIDGKI